MLQFDITVTLKSGVKAKHELTFKDRSEFEDLIAQILSGLKGEASSLFLANPPIIYRYADISAVALPESTPKSPKITREFKGFQALATDAGGTLA